jgi:dTDP-4-amino-4,6-dideoxygalactose transaminase
MSARRKEIAQYYIEKLSGIEGLGFLRITEGSETNWHIFGILVPAADKYWIMDALRAEGIMANVHYSPLHRNRFYSHLATDTGMPGSVEFFGRLLRLPLYPSLTDKEVQNVADSVIKVFGDVEGH